MDSLKKFGVRFGIPEGADWRETVETHLSQLPFITQTEAFPLFEFLFDGLPSLLSKSNDPDTPLLAEAYAWCCFWIWQCESAFPVFPENYAAHFRDALLAPPGKRDATAILIAKMLVTNATGDGNCGFNKLVLADAAAIRESERRMLTGGYEYYLNAQEKYEEFVFHLEQSHEFAEDWQRLKAQFPKECARKIIRRSPIPERNWEQGRGAEFKTAPQRFQAAFDLFAWKYFLWGMENDLPLLQKPSVVMTPHGIQIFIPGYLSFDLKRDLDSAKITRLHRARGVNRRQGHFFSSGRKESAQQKQAAKAADAEARRQGLKGTARYRFICETLNFRDEGDYRRLRKLLETNKK